MLARLHPAVLTLLAATGITAVAVGGVVLGTPTVPAAPAPLPPWDPPAAVAAPEAEPVLARPVWSPARREQTRRTPVGPTVDPVAEKPTRRRVETSVDGEYGVPETAMRAYRAAVRGAAAERPECGISWHLVAGIGRVESDHGRYGDTQLGVDGISRPRIRGVPLDGIGPVAAIPDSDGGTLDGDTVWDRAVGPMQFIPSTWAHAARDGDGDGVSNPDDLDDAALATAIMLCPADGSIRSDAVRRAQVFSYNHSDHYVDLVTAYADGYRTGVFDLPPPPPEPEPTDEPTDQPTDEPTDQSTEEPTDEPTQEPTLGLGGPDVPVRPERPERPERPDRDPDRPHDSGTTLALAPDRG